MSINPRPLPSPLHPPTHPYTQSHSIQYASWGHIFSLFQYLRSQSLSQVRVKRADEAWCGLLRFAILDKSEQEWNARAHWHARVGDGQLGSREDFVFFFLFLFLLFSSVTGLLRDLDEC